MKRFLPGVEPDGRLKTICEMVPECVTLADIGCDHGILDAYLLNTGKIKKAFLCDISQASLEKAKKRFQGGAFSGNVSFLAGDGAEILPEIPDCAVIAGMGTSTIIHILSRGQDKLRGSYLLLQPNTDIPGLRKYLMENGYRIADEHIVRAGTRHYVIIGAKEGNACYSEKELLCGPVLLSRKDRMLLPYSDFRLKVIRKALSGALSSNDHHSEELRREISIWEEVADCIRQ